MAAGVSLSQLQKKGKLACVGTGIMLGAHITPRAKYHIEKADVVFMGMADGIVEKWVEGLNPNCISLQQFYQEGTSRNQSYQLMKQAILSEVRAGKYVCGAFYGHPGVFAKVPHETVKIANQEGYEAVMEPGVSAEDCLFADLAIDPGQYGCQQFEASQMLMYQRNIDIYGYLILWQVGIVGDLTLARFSTGKAYRQVLVDELLQYYPPDHEVILYEASSLPINQLRQDRIKLIEFVDADIEMITTMIIPPAAKLVKNVENWKVLEKLSKNST